MASVSIFSTLSNSETFKGKFPLRPSAAPSTPSSLYLPPRFHRCRKIVVACAFPVVSPTQARPPTEDIIAKILSKVTDTDRGALLSNEEHREVATVIEELGKFCISEPVKSPLIFGEWDVLYCSNPTSPGGFYRSSLGRLIFKANKMVQIVESPDIVRNKVAFSAFGFIDGEVSLKGKLIVLDERWIQVIFEPPRLKVGPLEFQYGGESGVKLQIAYVDEKIRLGIGSRGALFVFKRVG